MYLLYSVTTSILTPMSVSHPLDYSPPPHPSPSPLTPLHYYTNTHLTLPPLHQYLHLHTLFYADLNGLINAVQNTLVSANTSLCKCITLYNKQLLPVDTSICCYSRGACNHPVQGFIFWNYCERANR